jgi:hypothetical protein
MPHLRRATQAGTVSATLLPNGICTGMYGHNSVVSLEFNEEENNLVLLLNIDKINELGISVQRVNDQWEKI